MEQTMKCPFCGEEIMAMTKKCSHCGEMLVDSSKTASMQQPVRKESHFESKYLYDQVWMTILFWITIFGVYVSAVHQSGLNNGEYTFRLITFAAEIPEFVGDFLCLFGEICFIVLFMKVFSNFHKPLKGCFLLYIVALVICLLFSLMPDDSEAESLSPSDLVRVLMVLITILVQVFLLPIKIVSNYEGDVKTLGFVLMGYNIAIILEPVFMDYLPPVAAFWIIFLIDFFYFNYLRYTLTKD